VNKEGVMYIATGERYVKAAVRSARTVVQRNPGLAIHLFTDRKSMESTFKGSLSPFSSIDVIENPYQRSKVDYMSRTPYERTLFLDADTAVIADIREVFRVLERFDIGLAHAMHRGPNRLKAIRLQLPAAFPEFNTGVILYRKNEGVIRLLKEWEGFFKEMGMDEENDQTTLRELLWASDVRIATLPPEYNVRFLKYHLLWSRSEATTKIFHLKQFHRGWLFWFNKKTHTTRYFRKLGLGWLVNLIKKVKNRA